MSTIDKHSLASTACGIHFTADDADDGEPYVASSDNSLSGIGYSNPMAAQKAVAIKLCGLRRIEEIELCNELKVDYIGFIFVPKSKRYVSVEQAHSLKQYLSKDIKAVGVFVNEPIENIVALATSHTIDAIQLHGRENNAYIQKLRDSLAVADEALDSMTIIKAISVSTYDDIALTETIQSDYVLLDSGSGGTGTAFSWPLGGYMTRPYFLAGGLNLENIELALQTCHPMAVDVSSGIETDGVKDLSKMRDFVAKVRSLS